MTADLETIKGKVAPLLGDDADPDAAAALETLLERSLPALVAEVERLTKQLDTPPWRDLDAARAEVERLRGIVARVQSLADVVAKLQPADPDTHDRDVSWLELLEALDPS